MHSHSDEDNEEQSSVVDNNTRKKRGTKENVIKGIKNGVNKVKNFPKKYWKCLKITGLDVGLSLKVLIYKPIKWALIKGIKIYKYWKNRFDNNYNNVY